MNLFDMAKAATTVMHLGSLAANAAKVLTDPQSSDTEKTDASKAKRLGDKKISEKDKAKMYNGGMAHGKKHMYLGGNASVKDNAGLRALKKSSPEAYMNIVKNAK
jgi:hypothetical protein